MCGITCAIAQRDVLPILLDGLKRLEYRGYDSAGVALLDDSQIKRVRKKGKVSDLEDALNNIELPGKIGIGHTRWATHGAPSDDNAHPHLVSDRLAIVHNGIIENYKELIKDLNLKPEDLTSDTDTEIIAHLIHKYLDDGFNLLSSAQNAATKLQGAYSFCVIDKYNPDSIVAVKYASPLVIGKGIKEHFLASDPLALQKVTQDFIYLEDGDICEVKHESLSIFDKNGKPVSREIHNTNLNFEASDKGDYRHYMEKEIFEQPQAIKNTLANRFDSNHVFLDSFGNRAKDIFEKTQNIQIIACGTSYHAGLVAKHWLESLAKIPCNVEIASEFRYRNRVMHPNTLLVAISQSGETADTIAAIKSAKEVETHLYTGILSICNVPQSSIVRLSDLTFLTKAGPEVGVASTKAFTCQLVSLLLFSLGLSDVRKTITSEKMEEILTELTDLPAYVNEYVQNFDIIKSKAEKFSDAVHSLFLGRGVYSAIAMEGALKLKEISYIHAEAYHAGELKHGPLALVDKDMPVIVMAPNDVLLPKIKANIAEVVARGGRLFVLTEKSCKIEETGQVQVLNMPKVPAILAPITYTIPLQLLAYYVAVIKGTDVDQPRNLAKSVTVE